MMQELKKHQINIFGETYTILSDEPDKSINEAVALVDSLVKDILTKTPNAEEKRIALFVAFKLASKMLNLENNLNKIQAKEALLIQSLERELVI